MSTAIFPRETDLDMPGMSMNWWRRNQWLPIEIITSATTTHGRHSLRRVRLPRQSMV
jgi:hypothetical protein